MQMYKLFHKKLKRKVQAPPIARGGSGRFVQYSCSTAKRNSRRLSCRYEIQVVQTAMTD